MFLLKKISYYKQLFCHTSEMSDSESVGGVPLIESLSRSPSPSLKSSSKRKIEDHSDSKKVAKTSKKLKRTKRPKDINEDDLDVELGINRAFSQMDGQMLADYMAQRTKRFEPNLSTVELEDLYLPGITILV